MKISLLTPIGISLLVTITTAHAQKKSAYHASVPEPTKVGVRYGDHKRHIMDLWQAPSDKPTPLVFVIHGGAWRSGSKERLHLFVDTAALLKAGISVAAINYRFISHAKRSRITPPVKAPLYDAARALQFIRSKSTEWNIDKKRIGAAGSSAGACSGLWLAFHDDLADPKSKNPVARESSRLWCAAVILAQTTLDPKQMKEWIPNSKYGGHAFGKKNFEEFLAAREDIMPWIEKYSPYGLVSKDDPPIYLFYKIPPAVGKVQKDPAHSSNFGVQLQKHYQKMDLDCELVYPGAPNIEYKNSTDYLIAALKKPETK